jgi:hypothetical protein
MPAPDSTPPATPTPQPNQPPTVTVSSSTPSCYPRPGDVRRASTNPSHHNPCDPQR